MTIGTRIARWIAMMLYADLEAVRKDVTRQRNERLLAKMKHVGVGCGIWGPVTISGTDRMTLGNNVHIGGGAFIRAEGGLAIGDNTHISRNLVLYTMNHRRDGARIPYDEGYEPRHVSIGANVWIGMNVCITPGTVIGDGAIVGMGTTLSGEVPPMSIVVGAKWRVVGMRDTAHYEDCVRRHAFGGPNGAALSADPQMTQGIADGNE